MSTDKNKEKCDKLLKHIFGSNFYFIHSTIKLKSILKSGKIKISTKVKNEDRSFSYIPNMTEDEEASIPPYAYCIALYDDVRLYMKDNISPHDLLIDPRILLHENVIFNSGWFKEPINSNDENDEIFSIYLNKTDSKSERLEKLTKIKNFIDKKISLFPYNDEHISYSTHEFLFTKNIDLKKYLIGIVVSSKFFTIKSNKPKMSILNLIKKKYNGVKIYEKDKNDGKYPTLMEVIC